jgi:lipoate-protein ligase A
LQHGSILLGDAHLEIIDLLRVAPENRDAMRERLRAKTATLGEIVGGALPSFDAIAAALLEGFVETFSFTQSGVGGQGSGIGEDGASTVTEATSRPID